MDFCTTRQKVAAHLGSPAKTSPGSPTAIAAHSGTNYSIAISVWFEGAFNFHTNVVCLLLGKRRELSTKSWQVQSSNLLIKFLREQVHFVFVALVLLPILQQIQLAKHLIRERARHYERWVSSGATQIQQPP